VETLLVAYRTKLLLTIYTLAIWQSGKVWLYQKHLTNILRFLFLMHVLSFLSIIRLSHARFDYTLLINIRLGWKNNLGMPMQNFF